MSQIKEINQTPSAFSEWLSLAKSSSKTIVDESYNPEVVTVTYSDIYKYITSNITTLRDIGLESGCKVVIATGNSVEFIINYLSCIAIGVVPIPLPNVLKKADYQDKIGSIQPDYIFVKNEQEFSFVEFGETVRKLESIPSRKISVIKCSNDEINKNLQYKAILISSGTSGQPKKILHHSSSLFENALLHSKAIKLSEGDTFLMSLPMYFSYGLVACVLGSLLSHCNIIISETPFSVRSFFDLIDKYQVNVYSSTPYAINQILSEGKMFPESLTKLTIGGDLTRTSDVEKLRKLYGGDIYLTYGLSEAGPRVFTNELTSEAADWNSMGAPLESVSVKLHNPSVRGKEKHGELLVKTPTAMLGYLQSGDYINKDDFVDGWLRTYDNVGWSEEDQKYFFINRQKDMVVKKGEKVFPGHIKRVLLMNRHVEHAYVYSEEASNGEYDLFAQIELKAGVDEALAEKEIVRWCRKHLRSVELPESVLFVNEINDRVKKGA